MTSYRWRCSVCDAANEPETDLCAHCGSKSELSAVGIERRKQRISEELPPEGNLARPPHVVLGASLLIVSSLVTIAWFAEIPSRIGDGVDELIVALVQVLFAIGILRRLNWVRNLYIGLVLIFGVIMPIAYVVSIGPMMGLLIATQLANVQTRSSCRR